MKYPNKTKKRKKEKKKGKEKRIKENQRKSISSFYGWTKT
jgi:hypothetical protein